MEKVPVFETLSSNVSCREREDELRSMSLIVNWWLYVSCFHSMGMFLPSRVAVNSFSTISFEVRSEFWSVPV